MKWESIEGRKGGNFFLFTLPLTSPLSLGKSGSVAVVGGEKGSTTLGGWVVFVKHEKDGWMGPLD